MTIISPIKKALNAIALSIGMVVISIFLAVKQLWAIIRGRGGDPDLQ